MKIEITKELFVVCLFALALVLVHCSLRDARGAQDTIPDIVRSTLPAEPDVHGSIYVKWHKVPLANMRHYCLNEQDVSCSIVIEDICHIFAPDTRFGLMYIGRAFVDCTYKRQTTARPFERTAFITPSELKKSLTTVRYWYAGNIETIETACNMRANACFHTISNDLVLIIVPVPKSVTNLITIGHEIKHVSDGLWHSSDGVPYPGVFIHDGK